MSNLLDHRSLDILLATVLKNGTMFATLQTSGTSGSLSELYSAISNSTVSFETHEWTSFNSGDLLAFILYFCNMISATVI